MDLAHVCRSIRDAFASMDLDPMPRYPTTPSPRDIWWNACSVIGRCKR